MVSFDSKPNVDPNLKKLYANLLRLDIDDYLISDEFEYLLMEMDFDELWETIISSVRRNSGVAVLASGFTGYAKDAFGLFLRELFYSDPDSFLDHLGRILRSFSSWKAEPIDFSRVIDSLRDLDFDNEQILAELPNDSAGQEIIMEEAIDQEVQFRRTEKVQEGLCFVLMPFKDELSSIYEDVIKPVVMQGHDLRCLRADNIYGTTPVIQDIWTYIQRARILIADLTGKNPNVFYELGLAHAINKDVILISQNLDDLPFDLRHRRCILYEDSVAGSKNLETALYKNIEAVLSS